MKRSMTLLEVVASLILLSLVSGALATWVSTAARMASHADSNAWLLAAEASLDRMTDDLLALDAESLDDLQSRVRLGPDHIEIRTRAVIGIDAPRNRVWHEYRLSPIDATVVLIERAESSQHTQRILLPRTTTFRVTASADDSSFVVFLENDMGHTASREFLR